MVDDAEPAIPQMPADMPQTAVPQDTETRSTSEISIPMLDVHPRHESIHTWRDFFIHIATIVVGLCIAVGLEQTVEFFHHRHQVSEIRESLRVERSINAYRFSIATEEFHRFVPKLQGNLAIFQYLLSHPGAPSNQWPGTLTWYGHNIYYHTGAWETAQRSGILEYMPRDEVRLDADLYRVLEACINTMDRAREAKYEAMRFSNVESDASHLSREQIAREIDLTSETLLRYGLAANAQNNVEGFFRDFTPSPSAKDVQSLVGINWSEKEEATTDDQNARMKAFEEAQGVRADEHPLTR
jgi:hypothetical protein